MNRRQTNMVCMVMALMFLAGCAAAPPAAEKTAIPERPPAPAVEKPVVPPVPTPVPTPAEERDLFAEGIALLNQPDRANPVKARGVFVSLLERFPESRLRPAAEAFIRLIDEGDALREASRQDRIQLDALRAEQAAVLRENESLKKTIQELTEKLRTETSALARENEKLKKDLQRLKTLEIELEKRERMLR